MASLFNQTVDVPALIRTWLSRWDDFKSLCGAANSKLGQLGEARAAIADAAPADASDTSAEAVSRMMATEPNLIADIDGMVAQWAEQTGQEHLEVLAKLADKYATDESESRIWLKLQLGIAIDAL